MGEAHEPTCRSRCEAVKPWTVENSAPGDHSTIFHCNPQQGIIGFFLRADGESKTPALTSAPVGSQDLSDCQAGGVFN